MEKLWKGGKYGDGEMQPKNLTEEKLVESRSGIVLFGGE
jgi:hypothetical protein